MDNFEDWFSSQDFYTNLRFIHGDALFLKDGDVYRVLVVRIASDAWQEQQKQIEGRDFTIAAMSRSLVLANAKVDELQARVDAATAKWISIVSILTTTESNVPDVIYKQIDELHDALCGFNPEQALKGGGQ